MTEDLYQQFDWYHKWESDTIIHIKRIKKKTHTAISTNAEKTLDKTQQTFMIKKYNH